MTSTNIVLDNPIWNAMISSNSHLATGGRLAKFFPEEVGPFAGLKDGSEDSFEQLYAALPAKRTVVFISACEYEIPEDWNIVHQGTLFQMTAQNFVKAPVVHEIIALQQKHVPQMLSLTALTNPGPFLNRTIEFGHYNGIFNSGKLVAMAGQRMNPGRHAEISAVCTHPDYLGKGYAAALLVNQASQILKNGNMPFLHVRPDNENAIRLYKRLGFTVRREMKLDVIQKQ